jgi:hypothetical protein
MVGYGSRTDGAEAVHDDLFVNAVALSDGGDPVLMVAFDLCLLTHELAAIFKEAITGETGLAANRIFLNTSHTHAGPTLGAWGTPTEQALAYRARTITDTVAAAQEALDDLKLARLRVGSAALDIGCNRREMLADGTVILGHNPAGPTVKRVTTWALAREGVPDIVLFSAPMHGTTMGGKNLTLSAEWMGMAVQYIEAEHPGTRAVFFQGCGADQDPYYSREGGRRGSLPEVEQHGHTAAAAVHTAMAGAHPIQAVPLRVASRAVDLPPKEAGGEGKTLALHGLRLGDAAILALSAETFVEFAIYGEATSPAAETLVLGYTDGNIGYLCTADAFPDGGYEIRTTQVAPESEAIVKDAMADLLGEILD